MPNTQLVKQNVDLDNFDDRELPNDVHIIIFTNEDGERQFDAIRAYSMVDIFDEYYDKLKGKGEIHQIRSGYGRIKPKLFGKIESNGD